MNDVVTYSQATNSKNCSFQLEIEMKHATFFTMLVCGLCHRPIPSDAPQSLHHLIPRSKGGKNGPTVTLHHLCHKEIHITLSETELARTYNNLEALRTHPRLAKFISWVKKRPPEFLSRSRVRKKK